MAARNADGLWTGRLSESPLATALALAALERYDAGKFRERIAAHRDYLARTQNADGGWGDSAESLSSLPTT
ncbi:MAG: squalene--hopene cyclase, partial [Kiritimatiellaeota bacterium]|nr:squalene--hopene cyclase [Kiritimatiellota bacterium]